MFPVAGPVVQHGDDLCPPISLFLLFVVVFDCCLEKDRGARGESLGAFHQGRCLVGETWRAPLLGARQEHDGVSRLEPVAVDPLDCSLGPGLGPAGP